MWSKPEFSESQIFWKHHSQMTYWSCAECHESLTSKWDDLKSFYSVCQDIRVEVITTYPKQSLIYDASLLNFFSSHFHISNSQLCSAPWVSPGGRKGWGEGKVFEFILFSPALFLTDFKLTYWCWYVLYINTYVTYAHILNAYIYMFIWVMHSQQKQSNIHQFLNE